MDDGLRASRGAGPGRAQAAAPAAGFRLSRFLLGYTAVIVAIAVALGFAAAVVMRADVRHAHEQHLRETARALARVVEREIETHLALARTLAALPQLDEGGDIAAFDALARMAAAPLGAWVSVAGAGPAYPRLVHTGLPRGVDLPSGLLRPRAEAPLARVFDTSQPLVGNAARGIVPGAPAAAAVFVPVTRDGRITHVLAVGINPDRFAWLLHGEALGDGIFALIADSRGTILARSLTTEDIERVPALAAEAAADEAGLLRVTDDRGRALALALGEVGVAPWTVAVGMPAAALDAIPRRPLLVHGAGAAALLLVAAVIAHLVSGAVVRPIACLAQAAEAVAAQPGQGPRLQDVPATSVREVETLRIALVRAERALEERTEHHRLMAAELSHRVKNALAVVQAALRLTPREPASAYVEAIEGRVAALVRANTLLAENDWRGSGLESLVAAELGRLAGMNGEGPRIVTSGPPVQLRLTAVQPLAAVIHELATNAARYGALSAPCGTLSVTWGLGEAGLRLDWREAGGPALRGAPDRRSFGTRAIQAVVTHQLGGTVAWHWLPTGLSCAITIPPQHLRGQAAPAVAMESAASA